MNPYSKHSKMTDQGWNTLYARLEKEGLLPDDRKVAPRRNVRMRVAGWAAAIAVVCLSAASLYYLGSATRADTPTLSISNHENSTTLVTSLEDGSMVFLADNARLDYPQHFASEKREVSLQGNAFFEVSGNPQHPFLIEAGTMQIEVIGTAFKVKNTRGAPFELSVQHGKVKVTSKESGQTEFVSAGETIQLSSSGLEVFATGETEQFVRYRNRVEFKDVPLGDILQVINQKHPGTTLLTTPALAERKLTVTFENDPPEAIAGIICAAFNLNCTKKQEVLLIEER